MVNRSNFPTSVDTFDVLVDILASDKTNVERYQTLLMQATRTTAEETEFTTLKNTLKNKIISAEQFNFLADSITNMQGYYLNEVVAHLATLDVGALRTDLGLPTNLTTSAKSNLVAAVNEVQSEVNNVDTKVGLISSLKTTVKTNTVNAINEVYDSLATEKTKLSTIEPMVTDHENRLDSLENNSVTFLTPTLFNGWLQNGIATPCRYWKDKDEIVHYELAIKSGSAGVNVVIMNFPVGYRPADSILMTGFVEGGATPEWVIYHVASNGELKLLRENSGNALMILNGSFKAVS